MKSRTTFCAAARRVGSTSFACIEPETSITSTIVASSRSARRFTLGRAKPTRRAASARRKSAIPAWRRHERVLSTTVASTSRFV
jgi:hypothetical protein